MVAARLTATRFCLLKDRATFPVVTINQRPKNDLVIIVRSRGIHRSRGLLPTDLSDDPRHGLDIAITRFSVHPSMESKNNVTTIKMTKEFENGQIDTEILYTTVVKQESGFCPIVFGLCPQLNPESNTLSKGGKNIVLGEIKDAMTFCYGIFVAAKRTPLLWNALPHVKFHQVPFSAFSIVIMYSFLTVPALFHGSFLTASTTPEQGAYRGLSEMDCERFFDARLVDLKSRSIQMIERDPSAERARELARHAVFLSKGTYDNQEFQA
jgi:hypothetical protein